MGLGFQKPGLTRGGHFRHFGAGETLINKPYTSSLPHFLLASNEIRVSVSFSLQPPRLPAPPQALGHRRHGCSGKATELPSWSSIPISRESLLRVWFEVVLVLAPADWEGVSEAAQGLPLVRFWETFSLHDLIESLSVGSIVIREKGVSFSRECRVSGRLLFFELLLMLCMWTVEYEQKWFVVIGWGAFLWWETALGVFCSCSFGRLCVELLLPMFCFCVAELCKSWIWGQP